METLRLQTARKWCEVTCESSPLALSRLLGLVATINQVPQRLVAENSADATLWLRFEFDSIGHRDLDLLTRKFAQLTEVMQVTAGRLAGQAAIVHA